MLAINGLTRVYFYNQATDMRKSFDGLAAIVREYLGNDPTSGHLFVFRNRGGDRVKILCWDRTGYLVWYKRLERGRFSWPSGLAEKGELGQAELILFLEGIRLEGIKKEKRFFLKKSDTKGETTG